MTPFHVGMKVVCVHTFNTLRLPGETYPVVGNVYTIRDIQPHAEQIGLRLEEIINPLYYNDDTQDCIFSSIRFRPVTKTSIDIFTAMLAPAPKQRVRTDA